MKHLEHPLLEFLPHEAVDEEIDGGIAHQEEVAQVVQEVRQHWHVVSEK